MKYVLAIIVVLALLVFWQHAKIQNIQQKNAELKSKNEELVANAKNLIVKMESYNEQQQKANRQIAKLKAEAMAQNIECYTARIDSRIIDFVRGQNANDN